MRHFIFFLLINILVVSCSSKEERRISDSSFRKTPIINNSEKILEREYSAIRFMNIDSLLVLKTKIDTALFKVFNSKTLKFLGSFGKKGEGPDDFLYPHLNNQFEIDNDGVKIWINDLFKNELSLININKSIDSNKTVFDKKIKTNPKYDFTHDLMYVNDTILCGNHGYFAIDRYRLSKYNLEKDSVVHANLFPKLDNIDLISRGDMYKLYFDNLIIKPDKSKLASAMAYFNRIDIFDLELNHLKEVIDIDGNSITDAKDILHKKDKYITNLHNYYQTLYPTNKYIYALHRKGQSEAENGKVNINVDIRVFDWEGNPKYLLNMPNDLTSFSVDEKNGWIYGVDAYNEGLYRYKIDLD